MKIKEVIQGNSSILGSERLGKNELKGVDFQKMLSDASAKLKGVSPMPSGPVSSASPLDGPSGMDLNQVRSQSIQATENTLTLLEAYQEAMANPEVTLKKMDAFIQSLSDQIEHLNTLSEKLSSSDPLNRIMTEVGIVSTVEVEKLRRGEYI
jgi:hypothetical protein